MKNLIGEKFNYLTVIDGPIYKNERRYWKCQCECGNEKDIREDVLKAGTTKSCGCYKKNALIKNNREKACIDLTNKRFGKLVAIRPTEKRNGDGRIIWECKCDCGNTCFANTHSLQQNRKQSCGCMVSQGEYIIEQLLLNNNINFVKQYTFNSCRFPKTNGLARFDFYIDNKYLIEYDGETHYKQSFYGWYKEEQLKIQQERDKFKNQWCKDNNIPLIRIPYIKLSSLKLEDLLLETSQFIM